MDDKFVHVRGGKTHKNWPVHGILFTVGVCIWQVLIYIYNIEGSP